MRHVVPSEAVRVIDRWFPWAGRPIRARSPRLTVNDIGKVQAFLAVVDAVPEHLITLSANNYADFVSEFAIIRSRPDLWLRHPNLSRSGRQIKRIRDFLATCPDDLPLPTTHDLAFITDTDLRNALRLDIDHAERARETGEWKAATVLSGSVVEALLLWKLSALAPADVITAARSIGLNVDQDLRKWGLHEFIETAAVFPVAKPVITKPTRDIVRVVKNFRKLIHPGRAERLGEQCDRGTALVATGGVARVVSDLQR